MFRHDSNLHMRKADAGSGPRLERKQDPAEMAHVSPSLCLSVLRTMWEPQAYLSGFRPV
jgi:hypothetical protein